MLMKIQLNEFLKEFLYKIGSTFITYKIIKNIIDNHECLFC
jgi:hypothetical protein